MEAKIAVVYVSTHHGNTKKVLEAMAEERACDLYPADQAKDVRWLREIDAVFGIGLIAAALIGLALIRRTGLRWIWVGYLVGYAAYGFALPHHIGTHDYYQTPLFPLA